MDVSNHSQDGFGSTENIGPKIVSNDRNVSNMESDEEEDEVTNDTTRNEISGANVGRPSNVGLLPWVPRRVDFNRERL